MAALSFMFIAGHGRAQTVVTEFTPLPGDPTMINPGEWYQETIAGGTVSTVDLTGAGGDLETSQPLPIGAARLVTTDNPDFAEGRVHNAYGGATALLSGTTGLELDYSYHTNKSDPSLKIGLIILDASDNVLDFTQLVYTPGLTDSLDSAPSGATNPTVPDNQWGSSAQLLTGGVINATMGVFWMTDDFVGITADPDGAGGISRQDQLMTMADWHATFLAGLDPLYASAQVFSFGLGLGTGQGANIAHFDQFSIAGTAFDDTYDFEPASSQPIPAPLAVQGGLMLCAYAGWRRRKTGRQEAPLS